MNAKLTAATELLRPASADAIAAHVLKLNRAGLAYPADLDHLKAGQIYAFAASGVPLEAIKRATVKIIQGVYDGISRSFMPTPPAFAALCRQEATVLVADRDRLHQTIESIVGSRDTEPPTEDAKERVRQRLAQFHAARAAVASGEAERLEIDTEERRAYWQKIASLPPAKSTTPGQQDFADAVHSALRKVSPSPNEE